MDVKLQICWWLISELGCTAFLQLQMWKIPERNHESLGEVTIIIGPISLLDPIIN